jgi:hypothetical protein
VEVSVSGKMRFDERMTAGAAQGTERAQGLDVYSLEL